MSKYELIEGEKANYSITRMVELLGVARSAYYKWTRRVAAGPSARAVRRAELTSKITDAYGESNGVYGAPRVLADLRAAGETVSVKTVAKLMRTAGLTGISPATWHPVTTTRDDCGSAVHTIPDLVGRVFDRGVLDAVWTSDITYLRTGEGWLYLCAVRDGCSRRVLGWAIAETLHTDVVEQALRNAVVMRGRNVTGVILHADRGSQYTSTQLAHAAEELGVRVSMGRTGVCWDNAQIESFWSTLKHEFYNRHDYATKHEARHAVGRWIEETYNRRRRHSALGMLSPVAFEQQHPPGGTSRLNRCPPIGVNLKPTRGVRVAKPHQAHPTHPSRGVRVAKPHQAHPPNPPQPRGAGGEATPSPPTQPTPAGGCGWRSPRPRAKRAQMTMTTWSAA